MNKFKKGCLAVLILGCVPSMAACSFKETVGILWNSEDKEVQDDGQTTTPSLEAAKIDETVEKPTISNEFAQIYTYDFGAEATPMTVEAFVSDGGTLSYQWFRNDVDSNGGGTKIDGAVESTFVPATDEAGISYYYVVVTNTVGEGIQLVASATNCVTVNEAPEAAPEAEATPEPTPEATPEPTPEPTEIPADITAVTGSWKVSNDQWWYEYPDGSYPSSKWEQIDGEWYVFDETGYLVYGWYQDGGLWYYLTESGAMARDTDVEGYHIGPDGVMQ